MPNIPGRVNPYLSLSQIKDRYVQTNFENLAEYFKLQNQLLDFKFFELVFDEAATGYELAHGFAYVPLDILVTRLSGTGSVTFRYGDFTTTNLVMDVSGPCRIRFYVGTYSKFQSPVQTSPGDEQAFQATLPVVSRAYSSASLPLTSAQLSSGSYPDSTGTRYTMLVTDEVVLADVTARSQTVTLPLASEVAGKFLWFKKKDTSGNSLTLSATSLIDGSATLSLTASKAHAQLFSDGTTYWRMDS